jgi:nitric oxide reductase NorE protein
MLEDHGGEPEPPSSMRRLPGEAGIWVFVAGDLAVFSLFFILLLVQRSRETALFVESQRSLNQAIGAFNTFLMLTSSLLVALAVKAARGGPDSKLRTRSLIAAAAIPGVGFVLVKAYEWSERFAAGQSLSTNDFFMYYFMYTGIHLVHVLIGLLVLGVLYGLAGRQSLDRPAVLLIESGGIFWHLVDLLWIILFALFYLVI